MNIISYIRNSHAEGAALKHYYELHFDYGVIEKDSRVENHVNIGNYYGDGGGRCLLMKIMIAMGLLRCNYTR